MKNFNKKCLVFGFLFAVFQQEMHADSISSFGQGLQEIVVSYKKQRKQVLEQLEKENKELKQNKFYKDLLGEIRNLPYTQGVCSKNFKCAKIFTADILLETADEFIEKMKQNLKEANWEKSGVKNKKWEKEGDIDNQLFVRKLILPAGSVIEFRGDLHGDVHSLIYWLDSLRDDGWFETKNPFKLIKKGHYIAFLGDYTDRGNYGAEVLYIVMQLFLHNPDHVIIVRGNHEDLDVVSRYGFFNANYQLSAIKSCEHEGELFLKFNKDDRFKYDENNLTDSIKKILTVYDCLPVAMFLGCENNNGGVDFIQCCHGGMEPGYDSINLLSDKANKYSDVYEWIDQTKGSHEVACKRHKQFEDYLLTLPKCGERIDGFRWNDFDFFNATPNGYISGQRRFEFHQKYTTLLLEDATEKNSKNKVLAVFRAHQHNNLTINQILKYGNGIYKLWNNKGSNDITKAGFKQFEQWSGEAKKQVPLDKYSVWTFNVAPRTGYFDDSFKKFTMKVSINDIDSQVNYDTVARLTLKPGFDNWTLHPRKIPVK